MTRNEYHHLYNTYKWQQIRKHHLASQPLCVMCKQDGQVTIATVCDHINPHKGDTVKFHAGPFQSLCKVHHDGTKARDEARGIVTGGNAQGIPIDPNHHWNK